MAVFEPATSWIPFRHSITVLQQLPGRAHALWFGGSGFEFLTSSSYIFGYFTSPVECPWSGHTRRCIYNCVVKAIEKLMPCSAAWGKTGPISSDWVKNYYPVLSNVSQIVFQVFKCRNRLRGNRVEKVILGFLQWPTTVHVQKWPLMFGAYIPPFADPPPPPTSTPLSLTLKHIHTHFDTHTHKHTHSLTCTHAHLDSDDHLDCVCE